jgi:hypothetical protein
VDEEGLKTLLANIHAIDLGGGDGGGGGGGGSGGDSGGGSGVVAGDVLCEWRGGALVPFVFGLQKIRASVFLFDDRLAKTEAVVAAVEALLKDAGVDADDIDGAVVVVSEQQSLRDRDKGRATE